MSESATPSTSASEVIASREDPLWDAYKAAADAMVYQARLLGVAEVVIDSLLDQPTSADQERARRWLREVKGDAE